MIRIKKSNALEIYLSNTYVPTRSYVYNNLYKYYLHYNLHISKFTYTYLSTEPYSIDPLSYRKISAQVSVLLNGLWKYKERKHVKNRGSMR